MKIVHICLACFYIDKMAYQENLITKFHAKNHEVYILTSDYAFNAYGEKIKKTEKNYINEFGIPVKVLEKSNRYGFYSRYKDFADVYENLAEIRPDIIFCHGGQFIALKDVIRYCKKHKEVRLYIDQHGDYYNTPVNTLKSKIVIQCIYGHWMRKAAPYVTKFWGVTPWRCQYLREVYKIPEEKVDLLPMGGDDDKIHFDSLEKIRKEIRSKHRIEEDDFLIITGGKIDKAKNIHLLIEAVKSINQPKVKLLIFGQPSKDFEETFLAMVNNSEVIRYIGWLPSDMVYDYFISSDLCAFPGTHSVLWEQACACGLPGLFRDWEGMHHVDVGGNAMFLKDDSAEEIEQVLKDLCSHPEKMIAMKKMAQARCIKTFSYSEIAKRAILEDGQNA
jgi:glycosyltransferase involved in cell wall biosynthesis